MKKIILSLLTLSLLALFIVGCSKPTQVAETTAVAETTTQAAPKEVSGPQPVLTPIAESGSFSVGLNSIASQFGNFFNDHKKGDTWTIPHKDFSIDAFMKEDSMIIFTAKDLDNKAKDLKSFVAIVNKFEHGYLCYQNIKLDDMNNSVIICQHFTDDGNGSPLYFSTNKEEKGVKEYELSKFIPGSDGKMRITCDFVKDDATEQLIDKTVEIVDNQGNVVYTEKITIQNGSDHLIVDCTNTDEKNKKLLCKINIDTVNGYTNQTISDGIANATVKYLYKRSADGDIDPASVELLTTR